MDFNTITIGQVLVLIAGITAIASFISRVASPFNDLKQRVGKVEEHQNSDLERLKALEDDTKMILKATRTLINHSITNNSTGELKRIQNEIDEYLINK